MPTIFISYRRDDAEGEAGRLFDDLTAQFGADSIFMDVVSIEAGRDFRKVIDQNVRSCDVLLAMIGKSWVNARDDAGRRDDCNKICNWQCRTAADSVLQGLFYQTDFIVWSRTSMILF